ncbi:MAG: hypothetical protein IAF38_07800, partial [Bacteroidia bacterium]|nr:hypothetical protein [Bacteroidia bacterium]
MKLRVFLFLTVNGFIFLKGFAQVSSTKKDTIINGVHCNFVECYPGGSVKVMGQKKVQVDSTQRRFKDSLREGLWMYYDPNGKVVAKGNFVNNK